MIIDIITLVLLVLALIKGYSKGLIVSLFSFLAVVIGLTAAVKFSSVVANHLGEATSISERWLPILAFLVVFVGVVLLVRLLAKAIEGTIRVMMLGWFNKLGGIVFYILIYFFVYSLLLFYLHKLAIIKPETAEASVSYDLIAGLGPQVIKILAGILPFLQDMFADLNDFFDGINRSQSS